VSLPVRGTALRWPSGTRQWIIGNRAWILFLTLGQRVVHVSLLVEGHGLRTRRFRRRIP